jgi:hypothetical protein
VNKFQRNLFYPVVIAFFLGCIISWLSIVYVLIGNYLARPDLFRFQQSIPTLLSVATVLMILIVFWTLRVSGKYFGAYERIVTDLDRVLTGKAKEPLKAREDDEIFQELLKRINALIERMQ